MPINLLFVYGSLRKGGENESFLSNGILFKEQAWTEGTLYDTGCGYPALHDNGVNWVYGELYQVAPGEWDQLHHLERYDGTDNDLFVPKRKKVYTDNGETEAMVYVAGSQALLKTEIIEKDWMRYLFERTLGDSFYYFAFGSCMDKERMAKANVDHLFEEVAGCTLPGYDIGFTIASTIDGKGRADMVESGGVCEGLLYRVDRQGLNYLYKREGVHVGNYRPAIIQVKAQNGVLFTSVLTFLVINKQAEIAPPEHYALEIIRGGTGWLSEEYLTSLKKKISELQSTEIQSTHIDNDEV
ncbi:gamma-glutamylcyclotransferase family protein [Alteribacter populi]|uniref:gamma-glutamylcyclotransferase family protein n=1 Tax=Alteribacter populi TaxID=2011011 RepID=UPI000BBA558A|nr:gamma-glutamylcyclotransferase family protein [Alteribacter populi]